MGIESGRPRVEGRFSTSPEEQAAKKARREAEMKRIQTEREAQKTKVETSELKVASAEAGSIDREQFKKDFEAGKIEKSKGFENADAAKMSADRRAENRAREQKMLEKQKSLGSLEAVAALESGATKEELLEEINADLASIEESIESLPDTEQRDLENAIREREKLLAMKQTVEQYDQQKTQAA